MFHDTEILSLPVFVESSLTLVGFLLLIVVL